MPIQVFIVFVFGICGWLAVGTIEPLMRSFANEAELPSWLFVAVPGLFAMLLALFAYYRAPERLTGIQDSLSRALLVALGTWVLVAIVIASAWCPRNILFACFSNTLIVSAIVAGGPLLIGLMLAGAIVGAVLRKRVPWLAYEAPPAKPVVPVEEPSRAK